MNNFFLLVCLLCFQMQFQSLYAGTDEFRKIAEGYLSVHTIKASIKQHIYSAGASPEIFSGNYFAVSGGLVRIDYILPEAQTVIINKTGLFWYYNNRRLLFKSDKKNDNNSSIPFLLDVTPRESLDDIEIKHLGMKVYSFFRTAEVYSVKSKKNNTVMTLWIDPLFKIIKRKYILDESGREIMREVYYDHACIDGIYIPSKIELKARTSGGMLHTVTEYSGIVINSRIDENLFMFRITPDMKVRTLSDK